MKCEPEHQRAALGSADSLGDANVQHMLSFCSGQGLFVMLVCKQWRDLFRGEHTSALHTQDTEHSTAAQSEKHVHVHDSRCTTRGAVFASASRLRAAHGFGLRFRAAADSWQRYVGSCKAIDTHTIAVAHELGLPLGAAIVKAAAASADLAKLKWLHVEQGCQLLLISLTVLQRLVLYLC
jgi:hypothetical protein